eukprot:XP_011665027.1 PREDICTED: uroporphyrinogen-III synthase [Strongylocentrotus purpuratus]
MNSLLLRSAQENDTKDKYQEAFQEADVDCVSLSPIGFEFIDLDTLYAHISHPEDHSGLIFSSPRTVQSVALCLERHDTNDEWNSRLRDEWSKLHAFSVGTSTGGVVRKLGLHPVGEDSGNAENLCKIILEAVKPGSKPLLYPCGTMRRETIPKTLKKEEWNSRLRDEWSKLPAFSVGTSTGGVVRKLGLHPMGEDSGNAENLCKIILEAVKPGSKPLLYPCGTMRRETIPKTLQKEGILFKEDVAYQTVPNPDLEQELAKYLQEKGAPFCIVFFSPSGVQYSKEVFDKFKADLHSTKLLAIGGTTRAAMQEHGYVVAGVAEKPNPTALLQAIQQCQGGTDG